MEDLTYFREASGLPSVAEQQALIRRTGVIGVDPQRDRAYLDVDPKRPRKGENLGLPERDKMIRAIRPGAGDVVHVAYARILAVSLDDALPVVEVIARRGATIVVASDGLVVRPDDGPGLVRLAQRIAKEAAQARTKPANAGRVAAAKRSREAQKGAWARAAELWPKIDEWPVAAIVKETGISASTLYRAQREGLLPVRDAQPVSARLALAGAGRAKAKLRRMKKA